MRRLFCIEMLGSRLRSNSGSSLSSLKDVDSDFSLLIAALKACSFLRDLQSGMKLHSDAAQRGVASNIFVANTLVVMYSKCGRMVDANQVFESIQAHTLVSWIALMFGYVENGHGELALELFLEMQRRGFSPNSRCFVAALKACSCLRAGKLQALEKARRIHSEAVEKSCEHDVYVECTLIDLYASFGAMRDAREVFDKMFDRNNVAWNALILGYAENNEAGLALELFHRMKSESFQPDARTFVAVFKACIRLAEDEIGDRVEGRVLKVESLERGRALHLEAVESGWDSDIFVPSVLVEMYSRCGSLVDARRVFDQMPHYDVVPWNSMILGLADAGEGHLSWELFTRMKAEGCEPNFLTLVAALKACGNLAASEDAPECAPRVETLEKVMIVHCQGVRRGCSTEAFLGSSLVDLYAKCRSMFDARRVFDSMEAHDVVCWTNLLLGYSETRDPMLAWEFFTYLLQESSKLDEGTMVAALKACILLAEQEEVKQAGEELVKLETLEKTMAAHSEARNRSLESDIFVASSLVAAYTKCGALLDARRVFDSMPVWDSVSWSALILGYAEQEEFELALELVREARPAGASILIAALKACAGAGALELVKKVLGELWRAGLESDPLVTNSAVESLGECGGFLEAQMIFDWLPSRSLSTWNSLLTSYSRWGDADQVFLMVLEMKTEGFSPDSGTFISILTACSHAGLVQTGKKFFREMSSSYGITPGIEHYVCMADLLGRANELDAAVTMVNSMPFEADTVSWITILGACHKWRNREIGKLAFDSFLRLEKSHSAPFTLMANIYSESCLAQLR